MEKKRRKLAQCPNCSYTFENINNYCPNCGQENHDLNVPVKHLIAEFFEGTVHFDTKVWQTLKLLILKPGLLTEKFNIGQRASYVPPFRLYVFISLIFFFILAVTSKSNDQQQSADPNAKKAQTIFPGVTVGAALPDSGLTAQDSVQLKKANAMTIATDSKPDTVAESGFEAAFVEKALRFGSKGEEAGQKLLKNISFMMFLLMPFFALLLYLFYRRHGRNYVEHLMFSIHLHTFCFILLIVAMLFSQLFPALEIENIVLLIMFLYLFLALRQVYKRPFWRTLFSLIPIGLAYLITLCIFFLGTIAVSVLIS